MNISNSLIRIVNYIWLKKNVSMADITEELLIEKSTVSRTLNRLKKLGLIKKTGELEPSSLGGRKTNLFTFNYKAGNILGVQVEQDGIGYVLTDLEGNTKKKGLVREKISKENIVKIIIDELSKAKTKKTIGVGISIPGIIDTKGGKILFSSALGLENFPLSDILRKEVELPIIIENDSNAGVSYFKLAYRKDAKNMVYFLLSLPYDISDNIGFGMGILIDEKIYHGTKNLSGEFEIGRPISKNKNNMDISQFLDWVDTPEAEEELIEFLGFLSEKLSFAISILDPEFVVIGGNFTLLPKKFLNLLIKKIKERISMWKYRDTEIEMEKSQELIMAKGAASIVLHHFFMTRKGIKEFLENIEDIGV